MAVQNYLTRKCHFLLDYNLDTADVALAKFHFIMLVDSAAMMPGENDGANRAARPAWHGPDY